MYIYVYILANFLLGLCNLFALCFVPCELNDLYFFVVSDRHCGKSVHGLNLLSMWLRISEANNERELYEATNGVVYTAVLRSMAEGCELPCFGCSQDNI